jgi:hypothetical protein
VRMFCGSGSDDGVGAAEVDASYCANGDGGWGPLLSGG